MDFLFYFFFLDRILLFRIQISRISMYALLKDVLYFSVGSRLNWN